MNQRPFAVCFILFVCCILLCLTAMADEEDESFCFNGAKWGMTKEEVRSLSEAAPFQEPVAQTGHSALVYRMEMNDCPMVIQYNFLPDDELYNITIMAPRR